MLIAAPHTSNWDLLYLLALAEVYELHISFMMKHTVFRGPFGPLFRALGGIPIRRHLRENLVKQMVETFEARATSWCWSCPPRARAAAARTGSRASITSRARREVPIVLGYLDYARRRGGFGPQIVPTGRFGEDMDAIRDFYSDKVGKNPELFTEPRLREEDPPGV